MVGIARYSFNAWPTTLCNPRFEKKCFGEQGAKKRQASDICVAGREQGHRLVMAKHEPILTVILAVVRFAKA